MNKFCKNSGKGGEAAVEPTPPPRPPLGFRQSPRAVEAHGGPMNLRSFFGGDEIVKLASI